MNNEQQFYVLRQVYLRVYKQYGRATTEQARKKQWDNLERLRKIGQKMREGSYGNINHHVRSVLH